MSLYPVSIAEARDPAGRFNVSAFVTSVHPDAEATPGKGVISSQRLIIGKLGGMERRCMHDFIAECDVYNPF